MKTSKPILLCSFFWRKCCRDVGLGFFFFGGGVGGGDLWQFVCCLKRLRRHQWSMRRPTCPPWEAVSHFCCFILLLPLQGHREQGQVCFSAGFLQQQPPSPRPTDPATQQETTKKPQTINQPGEHCLLHVCQSQREAGGGCNQQLNHLFDEQLGFHQCTYWFIFPLFDRGLYNQRLVFINSFMLILLGKLSLLIRRKMSKKMFCWFTSRLIANHFRPCHKSALSLENMNILKYFKSFDFKSNTNI